MNTSVTFNQLANIGIHAPLGAVSFHTSNQKIIYLIGATSEFIEQSLDTDAANRLRALYNMGGAFGWEITGAGQARPASSHVGPVNP
jgi:hypothetical protein